MGNNIKIIIEKKGKMFFKTFKNIFSSGRNSTDQLRQKLIKLIYFEIHELETKVYENKNFDFI